MMDRKASLTMGSPSAQVGQVSGMLGLCFTIVSSFPWIKILSKVLLEVWIGDVRN